MAPADPPTQTTGYSPAMVVPAHIPPDLAERATSLRYRWIPDHVFGEILSKRWVDNAVPFLFLVASVLFFGWAIPDFYATSSVLDMTRQLGELGLVVLAMMIVMVGGGIDLSVGSVFAVGNFSALALINLLGWQVWSTALAVVGIGALIGLVNGVLIGYFRLRAFLTTLATLIVVRAFVDMLLLRYAVAISSALPDTPGWEFLGDGNILFIPTSMLIFAVVAVIVHIVLSRMRVGWHLQAVGGMRRSAFNVGIPVRRTICGSYVVSGALTSFAGMLYAARLSSAGADIGIGMEIAALTGAVLGGNSLGGGRGSAAKAVLGSITVLIVTGSVVRMGLQSGAGSLVLGLVLLVAVAVDVRWLKNRDKILNKVYVSPTYARLEPPPPTDPDSGSPFAVNNKLREVEAIGLGEIEGPEDVIFDANDNLYCGNRLGDVVRFHAPDYKSHEIFAHVGGHPLGMAFDANGKLIVCVGGMGLYAIAPDRSVEKLTDETNRSPFSIIDDSRLRLADDCDIAPDGRIFFSEATIRYEMHSWPVDALESRGNGRIICYDPATGSTRTVLRNLIFPNGICVTHDGKSILFAESWACRVRRYWFDGPRKGTTETVLSALPGYPDNINQGSDGTYWVAIMGMRTPALDVALRMPGFRRRMARRLPHDEWLYPNINTGCVARFDDSGRIHETLWDLGGKNHPMITSMREHKGSLYLGGISNNRIGRYRLNKNPDQSAT